MKTTSKKLTLENMEKLWNEIKNIDQDKCESCDNKATKFYFVEGQYVGSACAKHDISGKY